jgi:hypothetical protein
MRKSILAIATGAVLAAATLAPTAADARCRGCGLAAGLLGGIAAGAIIGSAIAGPPVYGPPPGYAAYDDGYYAGGPGTCPGGYWARRPVYDGWGNMIGYSRPRLFCP